MRLSLIVIVVGMLSACGTVSEPDGPGSRAIPGITPDAVPEPEPLSKYGNPESYVVFGKRYYTMKSAVGFTESGIASWYGKKFHGRKTSSGEIYDMYEMTAAHKNLPLPTYVEVKNLANNRSAVVKVNDRGPFHDNRIIDLSYAAALKLGITEKGTGFVDIRVVVPDDRVPARPDPPPAVAVATPVALPLPSEPPATPIQKPTPRLESQTVPAQNIYLQVGAFQDVTNARRLVDQLSLAVPAGVQIREVNSAGRIMHRVQIGPVTSVEAADLIVVELETLGISDHHFVTN